MEESTGSAAQAAPASQSTTPTPSIGRIVLYNGHGHPQPEQTPAIIRRVNDDGTLDLTVFSPIGCVPSKAILQGSLVGQWMWPTRT